MDGGHPLPFPGKADAADGGRRLPAAGRRGGDRRPPFPGMAGAGRRLHGAAPGDGDHPLLFPGREDAVDGGRLLPAAGRTDGGRLLPSLGRAGAAGGDRPLPWPGVAGGGPPGLAAASQPGAPGGDPDRRGRPAAARGRGSPRRRSVHGSPPGLPGVGLPGIDFPGVDPVGGLPEAGPGADLVGEVLRTALRGRVHRPRPLRFVVLSFCLSLRHSRHRSLRRSLHAAVPSTRM
jgi:hypothetical protein